MVLMYKYFHIVAGLESFSVDMKDKKLTFTGDIDPIYVVGKLRKRIHTHIEIVSVESAKEEKKKKEEPKEEKPEVGPAKEKKKKEHKKKEPKKPEKKEEDPHDNGVPERGFAVKYGGGMLKVIFKIF